MDKPEFSEGKANPFQVNLPAFRDFRADRGTIQSGFGGRRQTKHALALMQQHHQNVMDHLKTSYGHEAAFQSHMAGLKEQSMVGSHNRNLEMIGAVQKASEGGTGISHTFAEGGAVSYTRKQRKSNKPKAATTSNFPPVNLSDEPQQEAPVAAATPAKTGPSVKRDPKTGQAVSLNPNKAKKAVTRKRK